MLAYIANAAIRRPADLLTAETPEGDMLSHPFIYAMENASNYELERLSSALKKEGFPHNLPLRTLLEREQEFTDLLDFLVIHPELIAHLGEQHPAMLGRGDGTLALGNAFLADETRSLYAGAEHLAATRRAKVVVMGHTHEAVEWVTGFTYINLGSWTRYYRFAENEPTAPWRILRERSYERFPYSLRYVLVCDDNAVFQTWRERQS